MSAKDTADTESVVDDNTAMQRFEMVVEGHLALVAYERNGDILDLKHTEVPEILSGKGVGTRLAKGVFDQIRASGRKAIVTCSFLRSWVARHPEVADLVVS